MRDPIRWMTITLVLAGAGFPTGASPRSRVGAEDVPGHVAEADSGAPAGNGRGRSGALATGDRQPDERPPTHEARPRATSLRVPPEGHLLRGTAGPIHRGKRRMSYESAMAEAGKDPRLSAYRERRRESESTVASQWALAEWCRRQRLNDQERAHLTAVIALDPSHRSAHRRLGDVQIDGAWVDASAVVSQRDDARRTAAAVRKHSVTMASLAKRIGEGDIPPDAAVECVRDLGAKLGVTALESTLATANEPAAMSVVRVLSEDPSDEASASLVNQALSSRWPDVRGAAAAALADRDRGSVVPRLIDAFTAPWISRIEWQRSEDGTLFARHVGFSDGAEDRRMTILDHVVVTDPGNDRAWAEGTRHVSERLLGEEERRGIENGRIAMSNQAIAAVLRATTGESMSDDPEEWRRWWSDETGTYEVGEKPLRVSYRSSSSTAVGVAAPPPPPPPVRRECLAAGTLVWTETGPVAVDRLQAGDVVLTQNTRTGVLGLKPVLLATIRPPERILAIRFDGETIRATPGHPFWVIGKGWTLARHLEPGNRLHGLDGGAVVASIEEEGEPVRTYNLVVADDHTYFCGEARIMSRDNTDPTPARSIGPGAK